MRRCLIAGTGSGCGKTTVVCGIMQAMKDRGLRVSAFKCGPDYIDPMFHRRVTGTAAYNLDGFFCDDERLGFLLAEGSRGADVSVIEGVMGYYDGGEGSAHSLARRTGTGAVIVIDCRGMMDSIGAVMKGFLTYREESCIEGFIFSRLPGRLLPEVKRLCEELGTVCYGHMPVTEAVIESRHLGLVTAGEIEGLREKLSELGRLAQENIDIDGLLRLTGGEPEGKAPEIKRTEGRVRIAVARDRAFCFIYEENLRLLEKMGCETVFFSPLEDRELPECEGILLYGGYPELYAQWLTLNERMLRSIRSAAARGVPIIAECGGAMYLREWLEDPQGRRCEMAGVLPGGSRSMGRLTNFGYAELRAESDGLLLKKGETVKIHEFHYWDSEMAGSDFTAIKKGREPRRCGYHTPNLYAGFGHIYFYSDIKTAERFVAACAAYGERNGNSSKGR